MSVSQTVTPLSSEDAQILALESGPIRGHTLKVLVVDGPVDESVLEELEAALTRGLAGLPRWRQRVVPAPEAPSGLGWQDDPDFDVGHHVRVLHPDRPPDESGLRYLVAGLMTSPLDRTRPLWSLAVVPQLADGRWALVWKVHHCLADGMTLMRVGPRLLWTAEPSQPRVPRQRRPSPPRSTPGALQRVATWVGHRGLLLREFRRVRELSPLAGDVGSDRDVAFFRCDLNDLHATGKAVSPEITVNDVLLAVITGALRSWLQAHELPITRMKVQVPVSMHRDPDRDDATGNRDSFLLVPLPLSESDPVARVGAVAAATGVRKGRRDAQAIYGLRVALMHLPHRARRALQLRAQGPHEYSLNVSNVPGPRGPIDVLGRRVDALYSIAEVAPHHGLRIAAVSLGSSLFLGLCADPRIVPDLDALAEGIGVSIEELQQRLETS